MKLVIEIELDNAAFYDEDDKPRPGPEVGRILRHLAEHIGYDWAWAQFQSNGGMTLRDVNGNPCGKATPEID